MGRNPSPSTAAEATLPLKRFALGRVAPCKLRLDFLRNPVASFSRMEFHACEAAALRPASRHGPIAWSS